MPLDLPEWLLTALVAALLNWGAMRAELRAMRRDIDLLPCRRQNVAACHTPAMIFQPQPKGNHHGKVQEAHAAA